MQQRPNVVNSHNRTTVNHYYGQPPESEEASFRRQEREYKNYRYFQAEYDKNLRLCHRYKRLLIVFTILTLLTLPALAKDTETLGATLLFLVLTVISGVLYEMTLKKL